jgi:hypothetical protein
MNLRTLAMLDGLEVRGTGLGLGAFKLILLPSDESDDTFDVRVFPELNRLLGLAALRTGAAGLGGGA